MSSVLLVAMYEGTAAKAALVGAKTVKMPVGVVSAASSPVKTSALTNSVRPAPVATWATFCVGIAWLAGTSTALTTWTAPLEHVMLGVVTVASTVAGTAAGFLMVTVPALLYADNTGVHAGPAHSDDSDVPPAEMAGEYTTVLSAWNLSVLVSARRFTLRALVSQSSSGTPSALKAALVGANTVYVPAFWNVVRRPAVVSVETSVVRLE